MALQLDLESDLHFNVGVCVRGGWYYTHRYEYEYQTLNRQPTTHMRTYPATSTWNAMNMCIPAKEWAVAPNSP